MNSLARDIRYGLRILIRTPGFTAIAVLTMALGIGANTAVFSVLNGVLLRPLPFPDSQRIVTLWSTNPRFDVGFSNLPVSTGDFIEWRAQSRSFDNISVVATGTINLVGAGQPEQIDGAFVSPSFFDLMGVKQARGRAFLAEEEEPGRERVIVISDGLWRRRFGGDPAVIGKTLAADDKTYTIIGVAPPGFRFPHSSDLPAYSRAPAQPDFWAPAAFTPEQKSSRSDHQLIVVARLRPGVSAESAQAEIDSITKRLELTDGGHDDVGAMVIPLQDEIVGSVRPVIIILASAIGFVLLIACANVANLQLTRATTRAREIAIRTALGASRSRIVRQLLIEGLIISTVGGAAGVLLNVFGLDTLIALAPRGVPRLDEVNTDWRVLGFSVVASIVTGLAFGLVPAMQASKVDLNESLKDSGRNVSTAGGNRVRALLVISEVAVSVVLLVGAGLLIKSFWRLLRVDPGFDPSGACTMSIDLSRTGYPDASRQAAFFDAVLDRSKAIQGVEAVGAISGTPMSGSEYSGGFSIEGEMASETTATADRRAVSPDYFKAMGIGLVSGRYFDDHDGPNSQGVAVVSRSWVERFLDGQDAVGRRVKLGDRSSDRPWLLIVGVVGDVHQSSLDAPARPCIYYPYRQRPHSSMAIVVKSKADPSSIGGSLRDVVSSIDKDQPISSVAMMSDYLRQSVAARRFNTLVMGSFGVTALVLAALGIYGVMAFSVTQRTHEFGVRMALGAQAGDIRNLVVRRALVLTGAGTAMGLLAAFMLSRFMSSLLFEVTAADPDTFLAVPIVLGLVALSACLIPAFNATRVDPMRALRHE